MEGLFTQAVRRAAKLTGRSSEELAYQVLPRFFLEIINRYLRVDTVGARNIPSKGPAIIVANHSGYMGFDALMLSYQTYLKKKRVPRIIAHKLWFLRPEISVHAKRLGLVPATYDNGLQILEKGNPLLLFPEGEEGNFKPTRYRYRLRRFRRGFVRLALATGAPIIPATVVGAEETHITLSQIRWAKQVMGIIVPVPLNVVPLPVRWHIRFHKPIRIPRDPSKVSDMEHVNRLSRQIRHELQHQLHADVKRRKALFL